MSSFDRSSGITARWWSHTAKRFVLALLVTTFASYPGVAENRSPTRALDVAELQLAAGVEVPAGFVDSIQEKLIQKLGRVHTTAFICDIVSRWRSRKLNTVALRSVCRASAAM